MRNRMIIWILLGGGALVLFLVTVAALIVTIGFERRWKRLRVRRSDSGCQHRRGVDRFSFSHGSADAV